MKIRSLVFFIVIFFLTNGLHSQTAAPFLLIQPSPELNGMAGAFTALPTDDPFGSYYNPAQIGNFGRHNNFAVHLYLNDMTWVPQFNFSNMTFNNFGIGLGYNFQKIYPKVPLSVGVGYIKTRLELINNHVTDENGNDLGSFTSLETVDAFSIGITLDYVVLFSLGYTFKIIESDLFDRHLQVGSETRGGNSTANAGDFGLQLVFPLIKSYEYFSEKKVSISNRIKPFLDLSFGYTLSNIGDGMNYIDELHFYPLPRQAKMGYAVSVGLKQITPDINISYFTFDWSSEARDILIERNLTGFTYNSSPGNIKFWDHVILAKSDDDVKIYQGWRIGVFESIRYSRGRFQHLYSDDFQKTWGLVVSTKGIFKYLNTLSNNKTLEYISRHFELRYAQSSFETENDPDNNGTFHGLALYVSEF